MAGGRGNTAWRTTEGAGGWLGVEKLVRGFAAMGGKQTRVSWTTAYGVPPPEEGGSGGEDDVLSGEEEHPTGTGTSRLGVSTNPHPPAWPASKEEMVDCYG